MISGLVGDQKDKGKKKVGENKRKKAVGSNNEVSRMPPEAEGRDTDDNDESKLGYVLEESQFKLRPRVRVEPTPPMTLQTVYNFLARRGRSTGSI